MFNYAQLNNEGICVGISVLASEVDVPLLIAIDEYDTDYMFRKFENGVWSEEKFNNPGSNNDDEFTQLKEKVRYLEEVQQEQEAALIEIAEMTLGGNS